MRKSSVIGLMLAFLAVPLVASAAGQTPLLGTRCEKERLGTTMRDTDDKNIVACLATDDAQQPYEWKSMSSSGSGGITGGCFLHKWEGQGPTANLTRQVPEGYGWVTYKWGKGCKENDTVIPIMSTDYMKGIAEPGYDCGGSVNSLPFFCVKK